ncbi:MAG: DUF1223 domain-containing protein [Hyphomicrobiaceae bacterium]
MPLRRPVLILSLAAMILAVGVAVGRSGEPQAVGPAVVELFTSQGCSSCPKADALLAKYAARDGIVALSFNVDYWDYLGWRDTLASPAFTMRWRDYAKSRGDGQVYTPQAVVNGLAHAIGSKAKRIDAVIEETGRVLAGRRPSLEVTRDQEMILIRVGGDAARPGRPATVWVAAVQPKVTVPIRRGENQGAEITYINVVRSLQAVGTWIGDALDVRVPQGAVGVQAGRRAVVLVQEGATGPMLAAAWAR